MSSLRPSALAAIFGSFYRDLRDMVRNPLAFFGGLTATFGMCVALLAAVMMVAADASAADDGEELLIDFVPGALVKLGEKPPEEEIPEKIITQDTRAEDEAPVQETITEDETQKPKEIEKDPDKKPKEKPTKNQPKKDNKLPTSKTPTEKNTPYDDLPTVDYNIGDPFGDADGWAELKKDGDPWATAVMGALNNNVKAATYGAKGADGDFRFLISIGKDGKICEVRRKGGSLPADIQSRIELDLRRLKLPSPPAEVLKKMRSNCARIRYTFRWSATQGVR